MRRYTVVKDTLEDIFEVLRSLPALLKEQQDLVIDFSNLRSKGAQTDTVGITSGVVSFIKVYDSAVAPIKHLGTIFCILSVKHPEILQFLDAEFENIKLGVIIEEDFISARTDYDLVDPFTRIITSIDVKALKDRIENDVDVSMWRRVVDGTVVLLEEVLKAGGTGEKSLCPECGAAVLVQTTPFVCTECGYSRCSV